MKRLLAVLACVLTTIIVATGVSRVVAQSPGENHVDWLVAAKTELHAQGIATENAGPCGAFQIINLAAFRHRETGIGILSKPSGNGCEWPAGSGNRYSVDTLLYPNGAGTDALANSEAENRPNWTIGDPDADMAKRWRAPIDPGFAASTPGPGPGPVPPAGPPPPPSVDLGSILSRLDAIEQHENQLAELQNTNNAALADYSRQSAQQIIDLKAQLDALALKGCEASFFGVSGHCAFRK